MGGIGPRLPGVLLDQTVAPTELVYEPFPKGSRADGLGAAARLALGMAVQGEETPAVAAIVGDCGIETGYFFDNVDIPAFSYSPSSEIGQYPTTSHARTEPTEEDMDQALKATMEALGKRAAVVTHVSMRPPHLLLQRQRASLTLNSVLCWRVVHTDARREAAAALNACAALARGGRVAPR